MADQIEIQNVGGSDGVASEATLKSLVTALEKMGAGGGAAAKDAERYHAEIKKGTATVKNDTGATKDSTKSTIQATKATTEFSKKLKGAAFGALGAITQSIGSLGKEFLNGGSQLGDFTKHFPLIGGAISPLVGYIDDSINSFRQLASVGANFGNSIEDMRLTAAQSGMTLEEFTNMVSQNSESLVVLGGSVASGVKEFNKINRELKDTGAFESLTSMGFSVMEINEGLADYAAQQARLGRLEGKSTQDLAAGAANYLTQLDKLARATGKSREELEAMQKAQEQDAGFRALLNQFEEGTEEFNNFRTSMTLIDSLGGDAAIALRDLADGVPQTKEAIALVNAAGPEIADAMQRVSQGADPQVLLDALANAGGEIEGFAQGTAQEKAAFIARLRETNPALAGILDQATQMTNLGNRNLQEIEDAQNSRDDTTEALTSFETSIREIRQGIQVALVESGIFGMLGGLMGDLANGIKEAAPIVVDWLKEFSAIAKEGGFGAAIQEKIINPMMVSLKDGIKSMFEDSSLITKIGVGLVGLFAAGAVVNTLKNAIGGLFGTLSSMGGGGSGGGGGGRRGGGAGRAGAGAGAFVGQVSGGAMSGVAKGLAAFASPQVAAGAAVLAGTILVIGAAVAGATWLVGKSLPTFAEGMEKFETLDGEKLKSAGAGMLAVAGGMAAMGGGTAVAGLGNLVGGITDGIMGFFGGDTDPLTKVAEFGNANIDGAKVKANAEAMVAFGNAMAAAGTGNAAAGAGGIIGAIGSFFADDPTDQVAEFGALNINAEGVTANANAMIVMAQGITAMATSGISDLTISDEVVSGFEDLSKIGDGLQTTALGMTAIGEVTNLQANMTALNSLDRNSIRNYNVELEKVVDNLERMNTELAKDNNGMFQRGTGTNAGTLVNALGSGEGEGGNALNTEILAVLTEIKTINSRNQRALDTIARNV